MSANVLWALAGTHFIFLMTVLGAAMVFFFRTEGRARTQALLMGFAGGVMTAAAMWSLLLPAVEQLRAQGREPVWLPPAAGILLGASFLALVEHWENGAAGRERMLFTAITLHNIPEGMAVGLAFALTGRGESLAAALTLALGIGVQNFPEGAAVALPMRQLGMGRDRAFFWGVVSGTVEPVFGMGAYCLAAAAQPVMPWLLGFSAGAMLYVTVRELCPEAAGERGGVFGFIGGFVLMMVLDLALG